MASDLGIKAKNAYIDDHFELAADLYTQAIEQNPESAELFAERAQAYIKLNYFTEAVADANRAIELDPSLAKAYLRKGTACFNLEEYQTAKAALETGAALEPENERFTKLIQQCDQCIAEEIDVIPNQSSEKTIPTNDASADVDAPADVDTSADVDASADAVAVAVDTSTDAEAVDELANQVTVAKAKPKYRHEFYQKPEEVVVTIFAKGIPANNVSVDFGEQILSVTIDVPGEDAYIFQPRLFGKIVTSKCRHDVLSTKIEIRLAKAEPIHWASLEFNKEITVPPMSNALAIGAPRPSYPSSKPKRTDWDKLEAEVKKEEKDEKLDGDAALNKFFRDIYADADEDTRRAMRKSFVESNGTVLSTNWKEVGSKKVEGSPPDGMEMKKWEY